MGLTGLTKEEADAHGHASSGINLPNKVTMGCLLHVLRTPGPRGWLSLPATWTPLRGPAMGHVPHHFLYFWSREGTRKTWIPRGFQNLTLSFGLGFSAAQNMVCEQQAPVEDCQGNRLSSIFYFVISPKSAKRLQHRDGNGWVEFRWPAQGSRAGLIAN